MKPLRSLSFDLKTALSPHPLRDWFLVLALAILLALALLGSSLFYFFGVRSGSIIGASDAPPGKAAHLSRDDLERAVELYETRRVNYEADNFKVPQVSDPSR